MKKINKLYQKTTILLLIIVVVISIFYFYNPIDNFFSFSQSKNKVKLWNSSLNLSKDGKREKGVSRVIGKLRTEGAKVYAKKRGITVNDTEITQFNKKLLSEIRNSPNLNVEEKKRLREYHQIQAEQKSDTFVLMVKVGKYMQTEYQKPFDAALAEFVLEEERKGNIQFQDRKLRRKVLSKLR